MNRWSSKQFGNVVVSCFSFVFIAFCFSRSARASDTKGNFKGSSAVASSKGIAVTASGSARVTINQIIREKDPAVWKRLSELQDQNLLLQQTNFTLQTELNKLREEAALRIITEAKEPNADAAVKKARDELVEGDTLAAEDYLKFLERKMLSGAKNKLANAAQLARERASFALERDKTAAESAARSSIEYESDNPKNWAILGEVFYRQGKFDAASEAYSKSQELAEKCVRYESNNEQCLLDLIQSYDRQGSTSFTKGNPPYVSEEFYKKGLSVIQQVLRRDPDNPKWLYQLARIYLEMGELQVGGTGAVNSDFFDKSLEIMNKITSLEPDNFDWQFLSGESYHRRGWLKRIKGDFQGALSDYNKSLKIYQKLDSSCSKIGLVLNIAEVYKNMGNVYSARGDLKEGLFHYENSVKILEETSLVNRDTFPLKVNASNYYQKVGHVYIQMGDKNKALQAFLKSVSLLEELLETNPGWDGLRLNLSSSYESIGNLEADSMKLIEGIKDLQHSLAILKKFEANNPQTSEGRLNQSSVLMAIGHAHVKLGKYTEAINYFHTSMEIIDKFSNSLTDTKNWDYNKAKCFLGIASTEKEIGNFEDAFLYVKQAVQVIEKHNTSQGEDPEWPILHFEASYMMASVNKARGNVAEALIGYENSLLIYRKVASNGKDNALWQHNLMKNISVIGDIYREQNKFDSALVRYRECLEIMVFLVSSSPGNDDYLIEISGIYGRLGEVQRALGDYVAAISSYDQSIAAVLKNGLQIKKVECYLNRLKSYLGLGDVYSAKLLHVEAIKNFEYALSVAKELSNDHPDKFNYASVYLEVCNKIGNEYKALGKYQVAREHYQRSIDFIDYLRRQSFFNEKFELVVAVTYYNLASLAPGVISVKEAIEDIYKARGALLNLMISGEVVTGFDELINLINELLCKLESNADQIL